MPKLKLFVFYQLKFFTNLTKRLVFHCFCDTPLQQTNSSISLMPRPPQNPPPIATTTRMETDVESIQNAFFAATVTSKDMNKSVPGRATSSLTTATKTRTGASGNKPTTDVNNDWSKLPFTAIKRKPITEIIAYLQAKGCDVIGADGKPLSKSQLIEAIFSF